VTLSLSQRSVIFFKRAARQRRVPYQRMIRALMHMRKSREGRGDGVGLRQMAGKTIRNLPFVPKMLRTVQSSVMRLEAGASGS
jgi:hypothetical protein